MGKINGKYTVLIINLAFLITTYFTLFVIAYFQNEGHYVYSLDDAYIHMAMAKNMALNGVWGVTKFEFTSSSSSILWTGMLSGIYYLFGVSELIPMLLNLFFASLIVVTSYYILKKFEVRAIHSLLILVLLIIITPLPPLMFTGLEHVMHIWVSLLFIYFVSTELADVQKNKSNFFWLLLVSAMLPSIRYEGIFLASIASILFLFRKKFVKSVLIFFCAFVPIYIFGAISVRNGWSFFPNSLLLKGSFPDITSISEFISFLGFLFNSMFSLKYLIAASAILLISGISLYRFKPFLNKLFSNRISYMVLMFIFNIALYAAYSRSGWSYRYQSFLVALGILIVGVVFFKYIAANSRITGWLKGSLITVLIAVPLVYFGASSFELIAKTPRASTNIYEQQYQMGKFLMQYYEGKGVALNDIGTSNYFADMRCVDLWGLSNLEISKLRRSGSFTEQNIREIALRNDVAVSIVYDSWFREGDSTILPSEWIKAGNWKITENVIAGDSIVSFYAVNPEEAALLSRNLEDFSRSLPKSVIHDKVNPGKH